MNTLPKNCTCTGCVGAACLCGCQAAAPATASSCQCGCQQGKACECGTCDAARG